MARLTNKVSIITGAAQGIGLATALKFAQEGAIVVICDVKQDAIDEAVRQCQALDVQAVGYLMDVTQRAVVDAVVGKVKALLHPGSNRRRYWRQGNAGRPRQFAAAYAAFLGLAEGPSQLFGGGGVWRHGVSVPHSKNPGDGQRCGVRRVRVRVRTLLFPLRTRGGRGRARARHRPRHQHRHEVLTLTDARRALQLGSLEEHLPLICDV